MRVCYIDILYAHDKVSSCTRRALLFIGLIVPIGTTSLLQLRCSKLKNEIVKVSLYCLYFSNSLCETVNKHNANCDDNIVGQIKVLHWYISFVYRFLGQHFLKNPNRPIAALDACSLCVAKEYYTHTGKWQTDNQKMPRVPQAS